MSQINTQKTETKNNKPSSKLKELFENQEMLTLVGFLGLCIFMAIISEQFLTTSNLVNVARQVSINGILAVGMTFVILTGGIDLSVGSVMAFTGTIMAGMMINSGLPPTVAVIIGIALGAFIGYLNGIFVAYAKIPAIIVTLAMMEIPRGLALLYTGGYPLSGLPRSFAFIGRGYILGIPMPVVIMIIVYILAYVILNHLPLGRYIYAIGGNEEAVRLSGVKVKRYKIIAYLISGFTASISGIILTSRLMSGQPMAGVGFELDAIAAVVLGGTDIAGGRGHILGTLLGALLMGVLSNGLNLMGVSPYVQRVFKGLIILVAIYYSTRRKSD
ncbi:ribose transport system permease protein RbsC [Clostridium aceticum]|uniref:Ribose transport system permease protein RbsC n=2 Tax=Clostridium aceticum TaxID=84022 RepID=A0A0D8I6G5_9CLOT|nr:ribose ABC transporter permease [Clostridium aceticum]AKL93839.1 ribose transport system permease protein RbsC [Clostridium aceticum]KJF25865.1 ribose ABC transporter permease [Clostridium aceticum]